MSAALIFCRKMSQKQFEVDDHIQFFCPKCKYEVCLVLSYPDASERSSRRAGGLRKPPYGAKTINSTI